MSATPSGSTWAPALAELERGLLQRDVAARALLLAALAGEHVLLLGPPGTAKSELARRLQRLLPGARYFERLLTRFTVPEELFGPLSLRALEEDRYERLVDGYLPAAEVVFLDEVFKANSAILNTLLGLLHERQFDNGSQRLPVPLRCLVGASNELPQDDSLLAFHDRFLLRVPVQPVDDAHFTQLLTDRPNPGGNLPAAARLDATQMEALRQRAAALALEASVLDHLLAARTQAAESGQAVSDRRWRQLVTLLQVQAASRGADAVQPWDLWLLPLVLAAGPADVPAWRTWFLHRIARTEPMPLDGLERAVQAFEQQLDIERRAPAELQDDSAGKLALARAIAGPDAAGGDMLRLHSERAQRQFSRLHVEARVAQCEQLGQQLRRLREDTEALAAEIVAQAEAHAWLPPSWREAIRAVHQARCDRLRACIERLQAAQDGFGALPVSAQADATPARAGHMVGQLSAARADQPYQHLETLPRELWRWAVVCSSGEAAQRLPQLASWRQALTAGHLPEATLDFGDAEATQALRAVVAELALPALTRGSQPLALQVLQSLLWHLDSLIDRPDGVPRADAIDAMCDAFRDSWDVQRQGWDAVLALLASLGDLAHLRWDDLRGQLSRREWQEAQRIGALLQRQPALSAFIDRVGRRVERPHAPPAPRARPDPLPDLSVAARSAHDDERRPEPTAVDGVRRSRNLARMTGGESVHLTHPVLRRLWRARFAESQLLTYDDRARDPAPRPTPTPQSTPWRTHPTALGHGPLIVCLDTSGSMQGAPEQVAKACVLQAVRSAHAGRRACRLLAFGGPHELLERELTLDAAGLSALLDVMGQNFDGGTDVQTPLERAIDTVQRQDWRDADLLIVSDGEFGVTHATLAALRDARQRLGLRVHGVLIGDRETVGLAEVCDHLHWVRDWRRYGHASTHLADNFSPVHSRSLTAMYFPNAIRR